MNSLETEILVIGGGATGTGVLRDLAMRGFSTILIEKGDLTHGTTGRYHGLLHSGARYVVKDPQAAMECIEENRILRRIMPQCIEDTGGFFVLTPWDDPNYVSQFIDGCQNAGIPVEEISIQQMLREEPSLNPKITNCFRVPDGSADSFLAADLNTLSASEYGAQVLTYHKVTSLFLEKDRVVGITCHNLIEDKEVVIHADLVVNASGAWAGQIAALVGSSVTIVPGKGTMIATNHRIVNTVINRCKLPGDGDIIVPAHTVAVIGTTDLKVDDPDCFAIEPWEVHLMLDEGEKLIPGFRNMRMLRAWAGVRPLYQDNINQEDRDVTRAFVLLDHADRECIEGLVTITSGKWTTYRKMAEVTADLVCKKLGTNRTCRTHLESLPEKSKHGYHYLGVRLAKIEQSKKFGSIICECELVTYEDIVELISNGQIEAIDDIRRDTRLGMGPCQGGFCTFRIAGILHKLRRSDVEKTNIALRDFLQERWKGLLPVLWGQQLRQEYFNQLIYLSILNADHLPGPTTSKLTPSFYESSTTMYTPEVHSAISAVEEESIRDSIPFKETQINENSVLDVLVIGAGFSGLIAGWQAAKRGYKTQVISKGKGSLYWKTGCVDILGYYPQGGAEAVVAPIEGLQKLIQEEPDHPYALVGLEHLQQALFAFQQLCLEMKYPYTGNLERNWFLPTSLGTKRPTCLAPKTMIAGDLSRNESMVIVGFEGYYDFYPELIADNINQQGIPCFGITLDIRSLRNRNFLNSKILAAEFEKPEFIAEFTNTLKSKFSNSNYSKPKRLGLPAVLGISKPIEIMRRLEEMLDLEIFEIPTLPPSIPGIRLHKLLEAAIASRGGIVYDGMEVCKADLVATGNVKMVHSNATSRKIIHPAKNFILATGGILGGGISVDFDDHVQEIVFHLPVNVITARNEWFKRDFLSSYGHPIFRCGISVGRDFRPFGEKRIVPHENLFAVGSILAHGEYIAERSLDGVDLSTGFLVGNTI